MPEWLSWELNKHLEFYELLKYHKNSGNNTKKTYFSNENIFFEIIYRIRIKWLL